MTKIPMIKSIILLALIFGLLLCKNAPVWAREYQDLNKEIASVNGISISVKDFKWAYESEEQRLVSMGELMGEKEMLDLKRVVFERVINREILYQESRKQNIDISQARIDDEFERLRASMISDIDLETIKKELDLNEKDIKSEFRRVMAIDELIKKALVIDAIITEDQKKAFYETNKDKFIIPGKPQVSHILILVGTDFTDNQKVEAREKIEGVKQELSDGKPFADLARKYSECPSSTKGGDIGYIKKGQTVKEFEVAAYALKAGEISDIVETPYGYHLIMVTDKMPDIIFDYDDIKEQLQEFIRQERSQQSELAYISKLKKNAKIEILEDPATIIWQD